MTTVYVLEVETLYENSRIVDVYDSYEKAEQRQTKIERACNCYQRKLERSDGTHNVKMPDEFGDNLFITKWRVK